MGPGEAEAVVRLHVRVTREVERERVGARKREGRDGWIKEGVKEGK